MTDLSISVMGDEGVIRVLNALIPALDATEICDEAAAILLARNRARFLKTQAPDGSIWQMSKAAEMRAAAGQGGATLFDTGRLFHSIQLAAGSSGGQGTAEREIVSDVPYGPAHYYGIGQVRRVWLGYSEDDREPIVGLVALRVAEAIGVGGP